MALFLLLLKKAEEREGSFLPWPLFLAGKQEMLKLAAVSLLSCFLFHTYTERGTTVLYGTIRISTPLVRTSERPVRRRTTNTLNMDREKEKKHRYDEGCFISFLTGEE